jgi:hypothetical protein
MNDVQLQVLSICSTFITLTSLYTSQEMSDSSVISYHTPATIDPIHKEILHIAGKSPDAVEVILGSLPPLTPLSPQSPTYHIHSLPPKPVVKQKESEIPRLSLPPLARELTNTLEGFKHYNPCNPNSYMFTLQDGNGNWVHAEFVRYHLDHDDPIIKELTIHSDRPYGAPLTVRALVWGKSSTVDDEKLISIHNLFKRTVDDALKDLGDLGLIAEVERYRALQQKLIHIQKQEHELDHETSIQVQQMRDCRHRLQCSCFFDRIMPLVASDDPSLHVLPCSRTNSSPIAVPNAKTRGRAIIKWLRNHDERLHGGAGSQERQSRKARKNPRKHCHYLDPCGLCERSSHGEDWCYFPHIKCPLHGPCKIGWANKFYNRAKCPDAWSKMAKNNEEYNASWGRYNNDDYNDDIHNLDANFWELQ